MVGFREDIQIKFIMNALRHYYNFLANQPGHNHDDLEAYKGIIQKIEFEFPWYKINGKFWGEE